MRVVKVETVILQKPIPVCDLTVNKYHNFLLDSGCFVHNSHIDCLLLGHFFRHLCPLIERGHVYLGLPPLYRISEKGKYTYLRDDADLNAFMRKRSSKLVGNDKSLIALAVNANKIINQIDVIGSTYAYSPYDIGANLKAYVQSGEAKGKTHIEQLTNAIVDMRNKAKCEAVSVSHKTESMAIVSGLDSNNRYFTTIVNDDLFEVLQHTYEELVGILTETVFNTVVFGVNLGENGVFDDIYSAVKGIANIITKGITITRNKGLGEMQPEELGETTLDIDARTLVRVTIDDFDAAGTFIGNMLHSKTVEARRQLIANTVLQSESVDA